ncbi:MAG TPA: rhomboid family intramembrane serine protease [Tepidisphaeraceae bacterium]|nr:rhomboid family intramembrane serine protease [Tepidisphaeraceae bacterium]
MILPIRTDNPLRTNPYTNWVLILVNVAMFILQIKSAWINDNCALDPIAPRVYQFVTYQFLHGGVGHLLGNMLFLYIFGNNLNDKLGNVAYLGLYLAGGVFAGVAYMFFGGYGPLIGASGSVSAVTGAFLVLLPRTKVTILFIFFLIGVYEINSIWFILAFFLMDLGQQFIPMLGGGNVAYSAHIGGTVFGVSVCLSLLAARLLPRDTFDFLALLDRWNRRRQHRDLVARGHDPFAFKPMLAGRQKPNPQLEQIQDLRATINESIAQRRLEDAATEYTQLLAIDRDQVMARQTQLDIANELFTRQDHPAAAAAYEAYLKQYQRSGSGQEQVQLMLGIIYSRYLANPSRARELLHTAAERLTGERERAIAAEELARLNLAG